MLLALMKKELLVLLRDPQGLAALFLMPAVFILVMSMALQDYYSLASRPLSYAVDNQDQGKAAQRILQRWAADAGAPVSVTDWRQGLLSGQLQYVLHVDPGFSQGITDVNSKGEAKLHLVVEPGLNQSLFEAQRNRLLAMVAQFRAELMLAKLGMDVTVDSLLDSTPVAAERLAAGVRPTAVQQNVPAWLVFGMFFVVASIAGLFVEERDSGALARLLSLGTQPWHWIVSKALPYLVVNGIQAVLMLAFGSWVMPLIGGEGLSLAGVDWVALLAMLAAISLAAVSLALAVACLVGTHAQAATFGPILNILMAALGGVMVPTFVMPTVMQQIAAYSPMNWGLEGLLDVLLRGGDLASVLPEAGRLLVFASLMSLAAYLLFRRRV